MGGSYKNPSKSDVWWFAFWGIIFVITSVSREPAILVYSAGIACLWAAGYAWTKTYGKDK